MLLLLLPVLFLLLGQSSSEFIWPPPSTVLRAPLTCNNVQCEVLSLSKALPSSSSFEEANQQRKQAEGRGHGKTSSEGSRARGRGMEMTSREEEERKGSVRASTAEGLYVEGVKNSWTWRFTEGMIVHVPLPDFSKRERERRQSSDKLLCGSLALLPRCVAGLLDEWPGGLHA